MSVYKKVKVKDKVLLFLSNLSERVQYTVNELTIHIEVV